MPDIKITIGDEEEDEQGGKLTFEINARKTL